MSSSAKPCSSCGKQLRVTPKSLPAPTCQPCRRAAREGAEVVAASQSRPAGLRSKRTHKGPTTHCGICAKLVYRGSTSAPTPICRPCRRLHPQRKPRSTERIVACSHCGELFTGGNGRKLCVNCRLNRERRRGSAAERGYGTDHRLRRRLALEQLADGAACPRCELPMDRTQALDLDHTDDRTGYLGLSHSWCNRAKRATTSHGQPRKRHCCICGATYTAKHRTQRCCSRACGVEMRRLAA